MQPPALGLKVRRLFKRFDSGPPAVQSKREAGALEALVEDIVQREQGALNVRHRKAAAEPRIRAQGHVDKGTMDPTGIPACNRG